MSLPKNRGLVKTAVGKAAILPIPIPRLRDEYILVKTVAVALNPTDWQTLDERFRPGTTHSLLGCDAAGVVVEVGSKVTKEFRKGDRVFGFSHGGNDLEPEDGCFAEYILMKGDISMHIPPNVSFEEAATLTCGFGTIGLGFYKHLGLPFPTLPVEKKSEGQAILIYGGSSASGTMAIQFAKLSGLEVITTASPRNFELLKSLGADHVFDYHDPNCGTVINALTNNTLTLVFDTIATTSSALICAAALSTTTSPSLPKKIYVNLMGIEFPRKDVENIFYLGYTMRGEPFEIEGEKWDAVPEDYELAKRFFAFCEVLLREDLVKGHPVRLLEGGLEGIQGGMEELREGRVSGVKLVARVGEP
ncbi:putative zinc-binding oxidoreductase ToxD [Mollisia scopiformis]|uniref:Putative zinc-binding oxidoreductase ToxD n=1 Tax=Mollisia scopiformis TaxID=149040 RepID=A0A132B6N9_MOLSC|nr:putative zinc-binding oxidoreductase ToxD [Mollisia scopiformis]KUJ08001.1 putative zinc-binding oxidoreductase ToxD [Mollisia scopiformis]